MSAKQGSGHVRAAGGVVWRGGDGGVEVLVVHRPRHQDWSWPKGKADRTETDEECAAREVTEETGYRVVLGRELPATTYRDRNGRSKMVRYWEMAVAGGSFERNEEVDEARWLPVPEADHLLSYDRDREVLAVLTDVVDNPDGQATGIARPSTWWRTPNDPADFFSTDELERAKSYQRPLNRLRLLRTALGVGVLVAFIAAEGGPRLLEWLGVTGWAIQLMVIVLALELCSLIYNPALDVWVDLVHDRRWGLSTQTGRGLAADEAKSFAIGLVLNVLLLIPLYALVRTTGLWWIWGWLLVVAFVVGLGFLYPVVIAPIFNTFTPLDDELLVARVQRIADIAGVEVGGTYVADESRRSRRDNAYVAGLGRTRRVVLFDTLLEHPPQVVEQVVAHEIGHWRLRHVARQIPLVAALVFILFALLGLLSEWQWPFDAAGVEGIGDPASLPMVLLALQGALLAFGLVTTWVSRAFERQADLEALELLREPAQMTRMQRDLHTKNLADLDPSRLRRVQATHPPAAERMAFVRAWAESRGLPTAVDRP